MEFPLLRGIHNKNISYRPYCRQFLFLPVFRKQNDLNMILLSYLSLHLYHLTCAKPQMSRTQRAPLR